MKIFLSGPYDMRDELIDLMEDLEYHGHEITSSWLKPVSNGDDDFCKDPEMLAFWAERDIADIQRCDVFIMRPPMPLLHQTYTLGGESINIMRRGGRHFETGIAHALGKRVIIFGKSENVFHSLFEEYSDFRELLCALKAGGNLKCSTRMN